MRRLSLLILCIILTFALLNTAFSEEIPCENGFYYEVRADGTAKITGYDYSVFPSTASLLDVHRGIALNPAYDVIIPSVISGHSITEAIIEPALWAYTFIPETVTHLEVRMPTETDLAGEYLFWDPEYIRIGIRRITDTACCRTVDGRLDTKNRFERIGVEIDENNPVYIAEDGIVYDKAEEMLVFAANSADTLHIGDNEDFKPIYVKDGTKRIGDYAFANCISSTVIVLPESVTEYGIDCFPRGTAATKLPVSIMHQSMYLCVDEQQNLTIAGWNQSDYTNKLSMMLAEYCGSETRVVLPGWNQYVYNLLDVANKSTEAILDPNSFTGLYIPSSVTQITFKPVTDEDRHIPCLIAVDDNEYYSVRETKEPQLIFLENDHPAFSMRNGMLYDKSGETLIYCPRRGNTIKIPERTKKVLKNAFLAWPGGTVIAAEDSVEWETQTLRDGSSPNVVSLSQYSPSVDTEEIWNMDYKPVSTSSFYWFPKKSGEDLYSFSYDSDTGIVPLLSVSGSITEDDTSFSRKVLPADDSDQVHLERESHTVLLQIPYAISEERFEYFTGRMKASKSKVTKKMYAKKDPGVMKESELQMLCSTYPGLAEGKTIYVLKEDLSARLQESLVSCFSEAGYTAEDFALDMSGVRLPGEFDYTLSCRASTKTEGRNYYISFNDLSLTSISAEKCEYITLNPRLGAGIPVASGFVYMPQMLIENAQYHASCEEDRWDWWYADLDANVNELPVYSQEVPDGVYICTVTSDMPIRVRVPADLTYLSTASGEYAQVQVRTDDQGNASGNVTIKYLFMPTIETTR